MSEKEVPSISEYREKVPDKAVGMYNYLISENCSPSVAAASSTYLCGVATRDSKTPQRAIGEHFDVSVSAIGKWYRVLLEDQNEWEWSSDVNCRSELLDELPGERKGGPKPDGKTKEELTEELLEQLDSSGRYQKNVGYDQLKELTGEEGTLKQKKVLEDQFDLAFGKGGDAYINITVSKSGVRKLLENVKDEGG